MKANASILCLGPALAVVMALAASPAAAATLDASKVLADLGFSSGDAAKVMNGEFVSVAPKPTSERDLPLALAFVIDVPPKDLLDQIWAGVGLALDPNLLASGQISDGGAADFAAVTLGADADAMAKLYRNAAPGSDLNLSAGEIATFAALQSNDAVTDAIRKSLAARYLAYHGSGLAGIPPYARDSGKQTSAGDDLRADSVAAAGLKNHAPAAYSALVGYPNDKPAGFQERYSWQLYNAHGDPTYLLVHVFAMPSEDGFAVVQRQFYVSRGFNCEQAIAGFLPVAEGTLVVYINRTSTDQITGFGGSAKRSIGRSLMQDQLEAQFEKVKNKVEGK